MRLTVESVKLFRNNLRRISYPEVKNSYITEGVARAFGFKTHAAMLVHLRQHPNTQAEFDWHIFENYIRLATTKS